MNITELRNGFEVRFDYNPRIVAAIKNLPTEHRRFNASTKAWFVSKAVQRELESIASRFGGSLKEVDNRPEIVGEIPEMEEPSADLVKFCEDNLKMMPYHYQLQGIAAGMKFKRFINGDSPGTGKTMQSIFQCFELAKSYP